MRTFNWTVEQLNWIYKPQSPCQLPQPTCSWNPDTCQLGNPTTKIAWNGVLQSFIHLCVCVWMRRERLPLRLNDCFNVSSFRSVDHIIIYNLVQDVLHSFLNISFCIFHNTNKSILICLVGLNIIWWIEDHKMIWYVLTSIFCRLPGGLLQLPGQESPAKARLPSLWWGEQLDMGEIINTDARFNPSVCKEVWGRSQSDLSLYCGWNPVGGSPSSFR